MRYENVFPGSFISRPNRFIALAEINGTETVCHVKNTGRCRELLVPGCGIFLSKSDNPKRKTKYDLIAVQKGKRLINMDSQAPNKAVMEFIPKLFRNVTVIKPEYTYKNSRFDFYLETDREKIFLEVKGVTLEENGVVRFPDAPTQRGIKHVSELSGCVKEGFSAYVFFVIQMENVRYFEPNDRTHKEFGDALRDAASHGVGIIAYDCKVTENTLEIKDPVEVRL